MRSDSLAVVVVTHNSADSIATLLRELGDQLRPDDELVVVDNASSDGTAELARSLGPLVRVIESPGNVGFGAGCQVGAHATEAPLLFFINPDCRLTPGCLDHLRAAAAEKPEWGAWQATVLLPDGRINTDGGVVHYIGIGWAGDCGKPVEVMAAREHEIGFPSGAALVIRRPMWDQVGGLDPSYFMYSEDLDLGLRLWLAGSAVGVVPQARVIHSYEFDKGAQKWFWLERNRWRTLLSVYPRALLFVLAPMLIATELVLLVVAARDGWLTSKLRAQAALLRSLPEIARRRRSVQATQRVGVAAFSSHLTSSLDSEYLSLANKPWAVALQAAYWRAAQWALRAPRR